MHTTLEWSIIGETDVSEGEVLSFDNLAGAYSVVLGPQYEEHRRETVSAAACAGKGVSVSVMTERAGDAVGMRMSVTNGSDRELSEVVFPDWELEPRGGGSGFTMPVGPGWWQPFEVLDEGEHINWNYPVFGSMQWVDYCDESGGLYVGVHDKTPLVKIWTIGKRNGRPWARVRFTDLRLAPGESYDLPPVVVCEHQGDWHAGARLYRSWAESWMEKPSGAEWYDETPAWSWYGFKAQHAVKPDRLYSALPADAEARAEYGVKLTNAAGWLEHGHDTHYPDYFAGESIGGAQGLAEAVDAVHAAGLRVSLYTNGRLADPDGSMGQMPGWLGWAVQAPSRETAAAMQKLHANFQPNANQEVEWNTAGTAMTEKYDDVTFAAMCPGSRDWRELLIGRLEAMARDYRVDGTFIDQICGAWAYPCYSREHDHARPNESWAGYLTLLKELRGRLRAVNPEFQMTTEGVCDILGQYFDVQQGHNDWDTQVGTKSRPMPELYGYTLPWYTVNTGCATRNNYYYLKLAHAVGSGLDLCDVAGDNPEERFRRWVGRIMEWRRQYADILRHGESLGALKCDNPHYLAHAFEKDGRVVATAAWVPYKCEPPQPETVTLRIPSRTARSARLVTDDGERGVSITGDLVTVPFAEIAILEIEL